MLPFVSALVIVLIGCAGLVVDVRNGYVVHAMLQHAVDDGVLSALRWSAQIDDTPGGAAAGIMSGAVAEAMRVVQQELQAGGVAGISTASATLSGGSLTVTAQANVPTFFLKVFSLGHWFAAAHAGVAIAPAGRAFVPAGIAFTPLQGPVNGSPGAGILGVLPLSLSASSALGTFGAAGTLGGGGAADAGRTVGDRGGSEVPEMASSVDLSPGAAPSPVDAIGLGPSCNCNAGVIGTQAAPLDPCPSIESPATAIGVDPTGAGASPGGTATDSQADGLDSGETSGGAGGSGADGSDSGGGSGDRGGGDGADGGDGGDGGGGGDL